jgi:N-acetylglucosamine kinase
MILCFDIGGSRIKAGRAGAGGKVAPLGAVPTPGDDFAAFVAVLAGYARPWAQGVAISIAGVVDPDSGRLKVANIPCLNGRRLARDVQAALGLPVWVFNDADCFALAEAGMGAGRGHRNVFGIILGTGVGGGLVIDGRIVTGAGGYAGEWGHGPVANGALAPWFPCGCGLSGCLDTVGGARGLERLHRHLHGVELGSVALLDAWQAGDTAAGATVDLWQALLAGPLAMVLNAVGSSIVPVGGGLANVPALITRLDGAVRAQVLRATDRPLVVPAALAVEPGLVGAALAGLGELARHG